MQNKTLRTQKGFTLIEVILTMAIVAIAAAMIATVVYSLIYMKNNTYADNDTRADIDIIEQYLNTIAKKLDKNADGSYYYFSCNSAMCMNNTHNTEEGTYHTHAHELCFYKKGENSDTLVFKITYNEETGLFEGKRQVDESFEGAENLPTDFSYTVTGRIEGMSFRCYNQDGLLIPSLPENAGDENGAETGTLIICEIYFKNTKGRIQTYTVIVSRKTTP